MVIPFSGGVHSFCISTIRIAALAGSMARGSGLVGKVIVIGGLSTGSSLLAPYLLGCLGDQAQLGFLVGHAQ